MLNNSDLWRFLGELKTFSLFEKTEPEYNQFCLLCFVQEDHGKCKPKVKEKMLNIYPSGYIHAAQALKNSTYNLIGRFLLQMYQKYPTKCIFNWN